LSVEDLRGRCPRTRVGLPPNPEGKGTDPHARFEDTFLTTLYVIADDFCQSRRPKKRPGPDASLSESEVVTLAVFARWSRFCSERDFYRYAQTNLTDVFPSLPERSRFNRLVRPHAELIEAFFLHLVALLEVRKHPYEALDSLRRCPPESVNAEDMDGLLDRPTHRMVQQPGMVPIGFSVLTATDPTGVITGFVLWSRRNRRPTDGRDFLCCEGST
jgi:hypothetical protein